MPVRNAGPRWGKLTALTGSADRLAARSLALDILLFEQRLNERLRQLHRQRWRYFCACRDASHAAYRHSG